MTQPPSILDHAIDYARDLGWPVFPCDPKTKRPLTENGFKDASTDPEQISAWWHRHPNAMIGIPTGSASHVVVLDVDVDPDRGIDGRQSLDGLELPPTMAVRTPRGGIHYYFDWPDGTEIRNSAGQIGPGLDVRGEGGYVIVPPSINAAGKGYEWATGEGPVAVPNWFLERTKKEERPPQDFMPGNIDDKRITAWGEAALTAICDEIALAAEGRRHDALIRGSARMFNIVAGGYSNAGHVCSQIWQAAKIAGLPAREIDDALAWGQTMAKPVGPTERHGPTSRPKEEPRQNGYAEEEIKPETLTTIRASTWHGQPVPETHFLDERRLIPMESSSFFVGATKVGKTYVALQASIACASGTPWLNEPIRKGPVIFYSAEENMKVLHQRTAKICFAENLHLSVLDDLHFVDLSAVIDASILKGNNSTGTVTPTGLYHALDALIENIKPVVVWLDNRGLLITGNENDRNIAAAAMRALQLLAASHGCAIILIAHPSRAGENDGSGASGSTAWFATGRSVLNMERPDNAEDGVRVLTNNLTNYAKGGDVVNVKWDFDRYICTDAPRRAGDDIGQMEKAERLFLTLLDWHTGIGLEVSPMARAGSSFAPNVFAAHKDSQKVTPRRFKMAMENLLARKLIEIAERGSPSKRIKFLRRVNCDNTTSDPSALPS